MADQTVAYAASYECAVRLEAAGCPLPYLRKFPHRPAKRRRFSVRAVGGYAENVLYDFGGGELRFVIGVVIRSEMPSGVVFADWLVTVPGVEHVDWDQDPWEVIPKRDRTKYNRLFRSRLMAVLDEGGLVARGRPVRGLICGRAFQPALEIDTYNGIEAKVTLTDDAGYTANLRTSLAIDRTFARPRNDRLRKRLPPFFLTPDPPRKQRDDWRPRPGPPDPRPVYMTREEFIKSCSERAAGLLKGPNAAEKIRARAGEGELEAETV